MLQLKTANTITETNTLHQHSTKLLNTKSFTLTLIFSISIAAIRDYMWIYSTFSNDSLLYYLFIMMIHGEWYGDVCIVENM